MLGINFCITATVLIGLAAQGKGALECPYVPPGTMGICVEDCSSDSDCASSEKCCSNGCGHTCQAAVCGPHCEIGCTNNYELKKDADGCKLCQCVHPCENKQCNGGEKCVLQEVQCITAPCNPVPTCVAQDTPCDAACRLGCLGGQVLKQNTINGCTECQCVHPCENLSCGIDEVCELSDSNQQATCLSNHGMKLCSNHIILVAVIWIFATLSIH